MVKMNRTQLEVYRDWLLEKVIPGFQRRKDQESVRRSVIQLEGIEQKIQGYKYPRQKGNCK